MSADAKVAEIRRDPPAVTSVIRHTVRAGPESGWGQDRHAADAPAMSASPPIASELWHRSEMTRGAISDQMQRNKIRAYSITSSARASSVGGTSRPSAFAVLRLITSSNLVGCCTGKSAGFAPLRILPMNVVAMAVISDWLGP